MLRPMLPFRSDESPISYASRMSHFHTGRPLNDTAKDLGLEPLELASNMPPALSRLAQISGVAETVLRWNVAVPSGERVYDLRGETVSAEFLSSPKIHFCPACLHDDDQEGTRRAARWNWGLAVVRTCPAHEVALQYRSNPAWNYKLRSMEYVVPETGPALMDLAAASARRAPSPLQDYVLARLEGDQGPQWLDTQTLDQAVRGTELLGVMLEFGPSQHLPKLSQDDWDLAGRVGYAFTSRGEAGIREALQLQCGKFSDAKGSPGTRAIFGCFYNALAHSRSMKDPGDIARITREFIWDNIAMPAGSKVLGQVLPERRLHTVASLAKETGHDPRRLRNILAGEGVIPHDAAAHYPIPAELGRGLAARVSRIVKMTELPAVLGCTRPLVEQLCDERLLTPVHYGRPGIKGKLQKGVDSDEVAALLAALSANSEAPRDTQGLVTIAKASEKAKIPAVCVVQLICAGLLRHVVRLDGMSGIDGLRVCPSEVKAVARASLVGMMSSEAFSALKLTTEAGWELADRHLEDVSLEPYQISGRKSGFSITRFLPESIEAFAARFATIAGVAEMHAVGIKEMRALLKEARVKPALDWRKVGIDIYRLSDVAKALPG